VCQATVDTPEGAALEALGKQREALGCGGSAQCVVVRREYHAPRVRAACCETARELDCVACPQSVRRAQLGSCLEDLGRDSNHVEPWRFVRGPEEVGLERIGEGPCCEGLQLTYPMLAPQRGRHLDSRELPCGEGTLLDEPSAPLLRGVQRH
jgi:hypothetical protein